MQSFCRTCFEQILDNISVPLNLETHRYRLMFCIPEIDLRALPDTRLCQDCVATINVTYEFKIKCQRVENMINYRQFNTTNRLIVNQEIRFDNISIYPVCRTCLIGITDNPYNFLIEGPSYRCKLMFCVPELNLHIIPDIKLCKNCYTALDTIYKFKIKCLDAERNIKDSLDLLTISITDFMDLPVWCDSSIINELSNVDDFTINLDDIDLKDDLIDNLNEQTPNIECLPIENEQPKFNEDKNETLNHKKHKSKTKKKKKLKRSEASKKKFKCPQCDYRSAQKSKVKMHSRTHSGEKPFKCSQCEYSSAYKFILDEHVRTHSGEKPFKCSHCEYGAIRKSNLKAHLRTHTGEKPFKCQQCDYSTAQKSNLLTHVRQHTDDKQFKCTHCDYSSKHKSHLKEHILKHSDQKLYECTQCEYKSCNKQYLKRHLIVHVTDKPFKCSYCEHRAGNMSNLKKHTRIHTG